MPVDHQHICYQGYLRQSCTLNALYNKILFSGLANHLCPGNITGLRGWFTGFIGISWLSVL